MNCKQFNSIRLEEVLLSLGHQPIRQNEKEAWYLSPFASESKASFKVDRPKNLWYLFSEGVGGTTTDFMQKYLNTTVKDVLEWASNQNFSSFHPQIKPSKSESNYRIDKVIDIDHPNLIRYLHERGLGEKVYPFIKELWFTIEKKQLYAVGCQNRSDGWELRNAFYKGTLHKKDIIILAFPTENIGVKTLNNTKENQRASVFEGFIDALSFIEMQKSFQGDILVLNSTALLKKALTELEKYTEISLFLDNDKAGKQCRDMIIEHFPHAKDFSHLYSDHKDLNQYLMEKRQRQVLCAPKTEDIPKPEKGNAEKQEPCKEETNRVKKGVRRRM
ncbi:toprim domain-containing protein [Chryseobacterium sp. Alg-005]|uniref:toprim domain-containing protein n=1 Tax=Chryseobacterium sp. Alg-005 TaxID=3159516 RepID=UPI0035556E38